MPSATRDIEIERVSGASRSRAADVVVVEEPLEIRISGDALAVTMRTPGADRELVLGFLWAEGIIASLADVATIAHCGRTDDEGWQNTIEVTPASFARLRLDEEQKVSRRGTLTTSACGVCGRRSIDDLLARCRPLTARATVFPSAIAAMVASLRGRQPVFGRTGGCHGAALMTLAGEHVVTFEDVGRHNAVDKVVGSRLLAGALPLADHVLVVSGRTSFEIVQKAVAAGISVVVGISAASSLAVDVAARSGVTLIGFARGGEFVVYAGGENVAAEPLSAP